MAADTLTLRIEVQDDGSAVIKNFQGNVQKLANDVAGAESTSSGAFGRLKASVDGFGASAGAQLGMAGALGAITAFVGGSVTTLAQYDGLMMQVQKTTGMSAVETKKLGDALRVMATDAMGGTVAATTLAEISGVAGQLGIEGSKNIQSFTQTIAEMSIAADMDATEAANSMARVEQIFKKSLESTGKTAIEQTGNIGSAFDALGDAGTATVPILVDLTQRMGGAATSLGLSVAEVGAIGATIYDAGVGVEVGGTAMNNFMAELAKNSDSFASKFKLNAKELATALKTDPVEALKMVLEGMNKLKDTEGPGALLKALDGVKLGANGTTDTLLKLSGALPALEANLKTSNTAFADGTRLHESFTVAAQGTSAQFSGLKEKSAELFRGFGEELKPATTMLLGWANGGLDVVNNAARSWRSGVKDEFFDAIVADFDLSAVGGKLTAFGGEISKFATEGKTAFSDLYKGIKDGSITFDEVAKVGDDFFDGLAADFKLETAVDAWNGGLAAIKGGYTAWQTDAQGITDAFFDGLAANFKLEDAYNAWTAGIGKLQGAWDAFTQADWSGWTEAPKAAIKGLFDSMGASGGALERYSQAAKAVGVENAAMTGLFQQLTDKIYGVEDALEVHSLTPALGRYAAAATAAEAQTGVLSATLEAQKTKVAALEAGLETYKAAIDANKTAIGAITSEIAKLQQQEASADKASKAGYQEKIKALQAQKVELQSQTREYEGLARTQQTAIKEEVKGLKETETALKANAAAVEDNAKRFEKFYDGLDQGTKDWLASQKDAGAALRQLGIEIDGAALEILKKKIAEEADAAALKSLQKETQAALASQQAWTQAANLHITATERGITTEQEAAIATAQHRAEIEQMTTAVGELGKNLGSLSSGIAGLGDLFGFDTSGITDFLGKAQQLAALPQKLGGVVESLKGIGSAVSTLSSGGGLGSAVSGLLGLGGAGAAAAPALGGAATAATGVGTAAAGATAGGASLTASLGAMAAAAAPFVIGAAAIGAAIWGISKAFENTKSKGTEAAESFQDFVRKNISGGAEMEAALKTNFDAMTDAGFDYQTFLTQTGTTMDQTFGGISANWQEGATAMDLFTQAVGQATGNMEKAPQVALQMMASFQDMGMSAEEAGAKMLEMARAAGMSAGDIAALEAALAATTGGINAADDALVGHSLVPSLQQLATVTNAAKPPLTGLTAATQQSATAINQASTATTQASTAISGLTTAAGSTQSSLQSMIAALTGGSSAAQVTTGSFSAMLSQFQATAGGSDELINKMLAMRGAAAGLDDELVGHSLVPSLQELATATTAANPPLAALTASTTATAKSTGDASAAVAAFQSSLAGTGEEGAATTTVFDNAQTAAASLAGTTSGLSGQMSTLTGQLTGTGAQGGKTTSIFDAANTSANTLGTTTDALAGRLGTLTGQLTGTGTQGAATNNVFQAANASATSLSTTTDGLSSRLGTLTGQLTGTGTETLATSNLFTTAGTSAAGLEGDVNALTTQTGDAQTKMQGLQQDLANLPPEKVINLLFNIQTTGEIPQMAAGGTVRSGLAIVNEAGSEIAKFPGGSMALMTAPGPVLGAFPRGTEIIPHARSMQMLRDYPNLPRMATGGTIEALPTGNISVSIEQLIVQGQMGQPADMRRMADELSREIAARLKARGRS